MSRRTEAALRALPMCSVAVRAGRVLACAAALVFAIAGAARAQDEKRVLGALLELLPDGLVLLDVGTEAGVKDRMVFDVYRPATVVTLPLTNERAYVKERVVGQVVVVVAEGKTSTGRLVGLGADAMKVPEVTKGDLVVSNPYHKGINVPPFVKTLVATPATTKLGTPVALKAEWRDEKDDYVYFEWKATGGRLNHARSSVAEAVWLPPFQKGTFQVTLTAVDTAGNKTVKTVSIESAGFTTIEKNVYEPIRTIGKFASLTAQIKDVVYDEKNVAYLVNASARQIIACDNDWNVILKTQDATLSLDLERVFVVGDALYACDASERRAVKLAISPKMLQDKPLVAYGGRGVGNGRFERPIDIAVDARGRVYVLDGYEERPAVHVFRDDGTFIASLGMKGKSFGQLDRPVALALSHAGRLYVLDGGRNTVLMYDDLQLASEAKVGTDTDVVLDLKCDRFSGRLAMLEGKSGQVRLFDRDAKAIGQGFGTATGDAAFLGAWLTPKRLRFDMNGALSLISGDSTVLHKLDVDAQKEVARWGGADLSGATKIAASPGGDVAVLVPKSAMVYNLDERGWIKAVMGGEGTTPGKLEDPVDVAVDAEGNVAVLDAERGNVQVYRPTGELLRAIGKKGTASTDIAKPIALGISPDRTNFVTLEARDQWNLKVFDLQGKLIAAFPGEEDYLEDPLSVCMMKSGKVHVGLEGKIRVFDAAKALKDPRGVIDPDGQNQLAEARLDWKASGAEEPTRLVVSNIGFIFALADGAHVQVFSAQDGRSVTQIKNPKAFAKPRDVGVDDFDRVYIWDASGGQIVILAR